MLVRTRLLSALLTSFVVAPFGAPEIASAEAAQKRPLTVDDSIQMRRVLKGLYQKNDGLLYSPNRKRYLLLLTRDDLQRNGTTLEIVTGLTDSLSGAQARVVATLFTTSAADLMTGLRPSLSDAFTGLNGLTWLDDDRVIFGWSDGQEPTQVKMLNVRTRELTTLTNHPTSVQAFALSADGSRVMYKANEPVTAARAEEMAAIGRDGFAVGEELNIFHLLYGYLDGRAPWQDVETYLTKTSDSAPTHVKCVAKNCDYIQEFSAPQRFSPDGRYAVVQLWPLANRDPKWTRYTHPELIDVLDGEAAAVHLSQVGLVDIEQGTLRELWSAPKRTGFTEDSGLLWSADSKHVVIGPTLTPVDGADSEGLAGQAFAEVDVATGRFVRIPRPSASDSLRLKRWDRDGALVMADDTTEFQLRKHSGKWRVASKRPVAGQRTVDPAVRLELRQDVNTPPSLYAVDAKTGRERLILEVEPRLRSEFTLARVEEVKWSDPSSKEWHGRLFYPVGYAAGRRYPLVINYEMEAAEGEFSLQGPSDGMGNCFASQALAHRGMAVLNIKSRGVSREVMMTPEEPKLATVGAEAAAEHFVKTGLVDRARIGLVGYSRTGWYVTQIIARSKWPFAAAITCDNFLGSYMETALGHGIPGGGGWGGESASDNGGEPFGAGLQKWLENAPGFNADKIRTPLRIEAAGQSGVYSLLSYWELYTRLRYLGRPIELVLMTESTKASHPLQMPSQKRFSQQATVDWMDFWLNGREDVDPRKTEQYERWRKLRSQQEKVIADRRAAGETVADLPPLRESSVIADGGTP